MRKFSIALAVSLTLSVPSLGSDTLSIMMTGDILLDRGVRKVINKQGIDHLFSDDIDSLFHTAHVVVGNLECPATKIKAPVQKQFIFRSEPEWLEALRRHGITHLNLANNHTIDQGRAGLLDTKHNVQAAGMVPIGAGATMAEASRPVLLASHPRKVWMVASMRLALENFAYLPDKPSVSQQPMDTLLHQVHQLRKQDKDAIIIVSLHWGGEHTLQPANSQRWNARQLILAGADVLVCHHTHTMQTIEEYRERKIFYSIGNFIFDQPKPQNSKACIVRLLITRHSLKADAISIKIHRCVPIISHF